MRAQGNGPAYAIEPVPNIPGMQTAFVSFSCGVENDEEVANLAVYRTTS